MNKALILYQPFDGLLNLIKYITDISYKAQWNDMQLRDCGDIAGLKRIEYIFEEILSSESAIKKPYLFKVSKSNNSFLLLGTLHSLPINVYSYNLVKLLLKKSIFIVEMAQKTIGEPYSSPTLRKLPLLQSQDESDEIDEGKRGWIEELPDYCQNWLSDISERFLQMKTMDLKNTIEILESFLQAGGMDSFLRKHCIMSSSEIIGLETNKEREAIITKFSTSDKETLTQMLNRVKVLIDEYIEYGCLHGSPEAMKIADIYLSSDFLQHHISNVNESLKIRNQIWMKRISKLVSLYPEAILDESILIAVGVNHLSKFSCQEDNLLSLLHKQGWEIARANLAGEFEEVGLDLYS